MISIRSDGAIVMMGLASGLLHCAKRVYLHPDILKYPCFWVLYVYLVNIRIFQNAVCFQKM